MIFPPPATPSFLSGCSCVLDRQGGWLAAPTLSLPPVPLTGRCTLCGESWFHCLPAGSWPHHQPTRAQRFRSALAANTVALRGARAEGKDTPAFKQHGTSSVRRPTLHRWHLSPASSAFTLGKIHALTLKVFQQHAFFLH